VRIHVERTRAITDFPSPRDIKGVRRFVGMANFYRQFILHFADVEAPLNALKKGCQVLVGNPAGRRFSSSEEGYLSTSCVTHGGFLKSVHFTNRRQWRRPRGSALTRSVWFAATSGVCFA
jgi:hypothetical protein